MEVKEYTALKKQLQDLVMLAVQQPKGECAIKIEVSGYSSSQAVRILVLFPSVFGCGNYWDGGAFLRAVAYSIGRNKVKIQEDILHGLEAELNAQRDEIKRKAQECLDSIE